jgi:intracellular sulfur oxidation DsrE/DsrF family protein
MSLAASSNPNPELLCELRKCGVEILVCGQSVARNRFSTVEVASKRPVAMSAMTVKVNRRPAGYAYHCPR